MHFLRLYFGFSGRMNRSEYAIVFASSMFALVAGLVLAVALLRAVSDGSGSIAIVFAVLALIVTCKWVNLAALAKRLHDVGESGALCLMVFVPVLGLVLFLAMFFIPGTRGANPYGPPAHCANRG